MTLGASHYYRGVKEIEYVPENLVPVLRGGAEWAEKQVETFRRVGSDIYPWRKEGPG